jgi:hypothetical protein
MKISVGMVAACSKTARTELASSANRWNSDQLLSNRVKSTVQPKRMQFLGILQEAHQALFPPREKLP